MATDALADMTDRYKVAYANFVDAQAAIAAAQERIRVLEAALRGLVEIADLDAYAAARAALAT